MDGLNLRRHSLSLRRVADAGGADRARPVVIDRVFRSGRNRNGSKRRGMAQSRISSDTTRKMRPARQVRIEVRRRTCRLHLQAWL